MNSEIAFIEELRRSLSKAEDQRAVLAAAAGLAFKQPGAESVLLYQPDKIPISLPEGNSSTAPLTLKIESSGVTLASVPVSLPIFISDAGKARLEDPILSLLEELKIKTLSLIPIYSGGQLTAVMEFRFTENYHRWGREDSLLLEQIADYCGVHLMRLNGEGSKFASALMKDNETLVDELVNQYERLAHFGNLMIIRTDSNLVVTHVLGETEEILGISPKEMINDRAAWLKFVHSGDLRKLLLKVTRGSPTELNEEIRVINQRTGLTHWLLLRAVPRYSPGKQFLGWEGYGVDITDKHNAQDELITQGKRIEALYAVSRSLQSSSDPALVTLKGLNAVVNATHSDCGVGYLYEGGGSRLEIVSAVGLSQGCLTELAKPECSAAVVEHAVVEKKGVLIDDLQDDEGAIAETARREGLRTSVVMPLVFEDIVLGVIIVFRRRANRYSTADFDLVSAASSQIALAAREAELYAAERRQSNSLAALYRLSHQLSRQVSLKEVIQNAFPVIREELACKRMWLGVVNDQGTHLVGQAGFGPGVRQHLIEAQIELGIEHKFLDQAISSKESIIVSGGEKMSCPDIERLVQQLNLGTIIIVPLVALGNVVGVLVIEPAVPSAFFAQRKLPLLNSMAAEIAPVILARKLEARMADAQKMRAASLLASGVAHNFNNLLQAVMGQASLIEMQSPQDSKAAISAKLIIEAATKGANLVKQLFSVSADEPFETKPISLDQMLSDSADLYRSVLGAGIALELDVEPDCGEVLGDYSRVQQVMTNLLVNSKDAIANKPEGKVALTVRKVRLRSGEVDPELAPGVYLRVDVTDNGVGMSEESANRCFEPFFTTKNADLRTGLGLGGSGLGLSSAYNIMKKHEGLITVRSRPGDGATFSLYFPSMIVKAGEAASDQNEVFESENSGDEAPSKVSSEAERG